MRRTFASCLVLSLLVVGCGEPVKNDHFAEDTGDEPAASATMRPVAVPVRVGELGPSFPACSAVGTTRNLSAGETLPVRTAPFDIADEAGRIAAGSSFFVCTRSHDQKWLGIAFDEAGLAERCGATTPLPARRNYEGPCRSGWVSAPFAKLSAIGGQHAANESSQ